MVCFPIKITSGRAQRDKEAAQHTDSTPRLYQMQTRQYTAEVPGCHPEYPRSNGQDVPGGAPGTAEGGHAKHEWPKMCVCVSDYSSLDGATNQRSAVVQCTDY